VINEGQTVNGVLAEWFCYRNS